MIRFAFASDGAYSTEYNATTSNTIKGVWIDNIDVAGVFTNDGEDTTGFESKSLVALGGDLWHIENIGVPPVIPMPENVVVAATDGFVEVTWDSPSGGQEYNNEWVSYDNGNFLGNATSIDGEGQGFVGNLFGMPYGVESVMIHAARVHASATGTTTLGAFAVIGGQPSPTPLYETVINTAENSFTSEIELGWEFQSSFVLALLVTGEIGLSLDESASPSISSWSNISGWSRWSEVASEVEGLTDGEFGIQARVTSVGGSTPVFNVYRDPFFNGNPSPNFWQNLNRTYLEDYAVTNGIEYCYQIASVYDGLLSELTAPVCAEPISSSVYDVIYDDGTSEGFVPVGMGNFLAVKFKPEGYPSKLYAASLYNSSSLSGVVFLYVWPEDSDGKPDMSNPLLSQVNFNLTPGWNVINFSNLGIDLPIDSGALYVGYEEFLVSINTGIDLDSPIHSQNSMYNNSAITDGWEPLNNYSAGGVWMIRAQMDGQTELSNDNQLLGQLPSEFVLRQNYPNPFNPSTSIKFGLAEQAIITLEIFNILGESVTKVVDESLDAGFYNFSVSMNGLASGMYFYRLTAISSDGKSLYNNMKKMILVQ